jgi:hypothetical protein
MMLADARSFSLTTLLKIIGPHFSKWMRFFRGSRECGTHSLDDEYRFTCSASLSTSLSDLPLMKFA